jgi:integrase
LHKNILNQTLNLAVKNSLILTNPCQFIVLPQVVSYESKFYSMEQLKALFAAFEDDPMLPIVKITALYGLRRSELLGLQWDSIDFAARTMTIRHTVAKVQTVVAKDKTKNASSHRIFPLTDETLDIFKAIKKEEAQNRASFGKAYEENAYVFKWPDGRPYSPDYITHKFSKLLKQHNLPHIRFHELRQCSDRYGMVAEGCAGVVRSLGYQNDRKHLFPFGYYQKTLHCIGAFGKLQAIKSRAQNHQNRPQKRVVERW